MTKLPGKWIKFRGKLPLKKWLKVGDEFKMIVAMGTIGHFDSRSNAFIVDILDYEDIDG